MRLKAVLRGTTVHCFDYFVAKGTLTGSSALAHGIWFGNNDGESVITHSAARIQNKRY